MEKKDLIKYYADFILYGNRTMEEAAIALGISKRTLQLYINTHLKQQDEKLYEKVRQHLENIAQQRHSLGGKIGKRTTSYDKEQIETMADRLIAAFFDDKTPSSVKETKTLEQLSSQYKIPKSTLYDLLMKSLDNERKSQIKSIFEYNKTIGKSTPKAIEDDLKYYDKPQEEKVIKDNIDISQIESSKKSGSNKR